MTTTKGITSPALGSLSWDTPLNANFAAIEKAFGTAINITATSGNYVLTTSDIGNMALRCVGALTADVTLQVPLLTAGQWVVINGTTDASGGPWSLYMVSAGGGTPVKIERGTTRSIYSDGTAGGVVFADSSVTAGSPSEVIYNNAGMLTGSSGLTTDGINLSVAGSSSALQFRSNSYKDASGGNTASINGITPVLATQAQAQAGTDNTTLMTPLRSQQQFEARTFQSGTITNVTASRALATRYQNTTNGWLFVSAQISANGAAFWIGPTTASMQPIISTNQANAYTGSFVPPGAYYMVTGSGLLAWYEG